MTEEEIIAARHEYEGCLWAAFGETLLVMPDMRTARQEYNERSAALYDALPSSVKSTLKPWQRPSTKRNRK